MALRVELHGQTMDANSSSENMKQSIQFNAEWIRIHFQTFKVQLRHTLIELNMYGMLPAIQSSLNASLILAKP